MTRSVRVSLAAALAALAMLAFGSSASGQLVVGQTTPPGSISEPCEYSKAYDEIQANVAAGNS